MPLELREWHAARKSNHKERGRPKNILLRKISTAGREEKDKEIRQKSDKILVYLNLVSS